jgi:hypothetical protein
LAQSLIRTRGDAAQALQVGGRTLAAAHEQIAGILRSRLGQNHAELLAVPKPDADGGIAWSTNLAGAVTPAAQLPEDERAKLQQRAERFLSEIRGLAQQLRGEGPASAVVAQMLEQAVRQPPGEWLYSVGGRPVLVLWGHAAAGTPVAPVAAVPVATAAVAAPVAAAAPPAVVAPIPPSSTPPSPQAAPRTGKPWWLWVLLALVLLYLLFFGLKRCSATPPVADAALDEQLAQAEARNKALEDELAAKRGARPQMQCVPDPAPPAPAPPVAAAPPPPAPPPEPKPKEPAAPPPPPARAEVPKPQPAPPAPPAAEAPRAPQPADPPRATACKPRQPGDEPEVVMIFDASGSMRQPFGSSPSRLDAAKRAAESMIRALPADVDVGLVDFGSCGQVRRDRFYPSAQRGALVGEINGLAPKQGTPLADAIRRAGTVASDSAASVLVIVSDGGDSCGGDPCAMARSVKASKPNVTINVIDLSETPADRQVLQCIASAGGGRLLSPGDPADMNRKMREAAGAANCP